MIFLHDGKALVVVRKDGSIIVNDLRDKTHGANTIIVSPCNIQPRLLKCLHSSKLGRLMSCIDPYGVWGIVKDDRLNIYYTSLPLVPQTNRSSVVEMLPIINEKLAD